MKRDTGFVTLVILLSVAKPVFADGYPEQWFKCRSDAECVKDYDCADIAINRNYLQSFADMQRGCDASAIPNPDAMAKCLLGKCRIVIPKGKK